MKRIFLIVLIFQSVLYAQNPDIDMLRHVNLQRNRSLDRSFLDLSNTAGFISAGIPLVMLGTGLLTKDSLTTRNALFIGTSLTAATVISLGLKYSINRQRPFESYPDIQKCADGGSPSFPSGHASAAFATATSVSLDYPKWYIITPAFIWAGAVGWSRIDLGVHYPSDVLVGALVGAGSAYLCHIINRRLKIKRIPGKQHSKLISCNPQQNPLVP